VMKLLSKLLILRLSVSSIISTSISISSSHPLSMYDGNFASEQAARFNANGYRLLSISNSWRKLMKMEVGMMARGEEEDACYDIVL
jgi:hypothetical protein